MIGTATIFAADFGYRVGALSVVIAIGTALAALVIVGRRAAARQRPRVFWVILLASSAGLATIETVHVVDAILLHFHLRAESTVIDDIFIGSLVAILVAALTMVHNRRFSRQALELETSEKCYRSVFAGSMAGVYRSTLDGRVLDCNPAYCELFGYGSREEAMAQNAVERYATADDRNGFLARLQREKKIANLEICLRRRDGSPVWVLMNATLREVDEEPRPIVDGTLIDISERRRAEDDVRKLAAIVQASGDAIIRLSIDGIIQTWNAGAERLFGYLAPEVFGKHMRMFLPSELASEGEVILRQILLGTQVGPFDSVRLRKDGRRIHVSLTVSPINDAGGEVIGIAIIGRDISERKLAEHAAKKWEQRLELAQQAGLGIGLWDWDVATGAVIWSDETYRQFGFSREEFSGRVQDAAERIHPEDRPRVEKAMQQVLAGAVKYASQYRLVWPDGTICWVDAHGVIVRESSPHMIGIGVDITELKRKEEALKDSKGKYLALLNSTAEAIYGLDLQGNCTFCNPACVRMLAYSAAQDLLGKNMHDLMHHTRSDGSPYLNVECEISLAPREGTANHVSDEVLWRADGTSFPAEYWSYPIYKEGAITGAVVTFLDISDRKMAEQALRESEDRYRQLFENATYGIFLSKPDGTLLNVNSALVTMLGYGSREELLTRNLDRDIYEDPAARRSILDRLQGRVERVEVSWKRKCGKIICVRMSGGAVRGQDGSISHFEVMVEDITERHILEEQFRQAQKMEAVGRLAGGVAHDFNNLLMIINTYSQMLGERLTDDAKLRGMAELILSAGRKAALLTQQLLTFSRRQVLRTMVLDLNVVLADLGKMLPRLIGEDIDLRIIPATDLGKINADASQLQQVILNLAVNSRDAMPNGGRLTIETTNTQSEEAKSQLGGVVAAGPYVKLSVSDTGTGMDAATQSRIFEPFFTTKGVDKGTGLGLSIVFGAVKQSGGYISVDSTPDQGTTFNIFLPRVEQAMARKALAHGAILRGTETVLLVEDAEGVRAAVSDFLQDTGYQVLNAANPAAALALLKHQALPVHLLLTDVIMPGMNGRELARLVKAEHPETQVLFMSGYADRGAAGNEPMNLGADSLQKPFALDHLSRKMREILERQEIRQLGD